MNHEENTSRSVNARQRCSTEQGKCRSIRMSRCIQLVVVVLGRCPKIMRLFRVEMFKTVYPAKIQGATTKEKRKRSVHPETKIRQTPPASLACGLLIVVQLLSILRFTACMSKNCPREAFRQFPQGEFVFPLSLWGGQETGPVETAQDRKPARMHGLPVSKKRDTWQNGPFTFNRRTLFSNST